MKPQENLPKMFLLATSDDLKSTGYTETMMKHLRPSMIAACLRKGERTSHGTSKSSKWEADISC
ncbi:hypothetical protein COCNU_scaffold056769G000010 [Cocos nucifera]|nr:hypothetical protein [Cocos nucifera]